MIFTIVKCEMCENQFRVSSSAMRDFAWSVPDDWFTLAEGKPHLVEGWHFCSDNCMRQWLTDRATQDWEQLSEQQKDALVRERSETAGYLAALTKLFEQEHPELRLIWSLTLDARLREEKSC